MQTSHLDLAVTHLNASIGPALNAEQLAAALRSGSCKGASTSTAAAAISSLFVELTPNIILQCAAEAGADLHQVNALYLESLADFMPPSSEWEASVEHLL